MEGLAVRRCRLTEGQLAIVRLAADGLVRKAIATKLGISESVVGHECARVFAKLKADTMPQAVAICIRRGWI